LKKELFLAVNIFFIIPLLSVDNNFLILIVSVPCLSSAIIDDLIFLILFFLFPKNSIVFILKGRFLNIYEIIEIK